MNNGNTILAVGIAGIIGWIAWVSKRLFDFVPRKEINGRLIRIEDKIDKLHEQLRQRD